MKFTTVMATDQASQARTPEEMGAEIAPEQVSLGSLPKVLWAGATLFVMNTIIGMAMFVTPNVEADMFGHEVRATSAALKPSPFAQGSEPSTKKVQTAVKLTPVIDTAPVLEQVSMAEAAMTTLSLDIPRASKVSYQLDLPGRTQNAIYETPGATPRPLEAVKKAIVIN